jgi:hypothetical protein
LPAAWTRWASTSWLFHALLAFVDEARLRYEKQVAERRFDWRWLELALSESLAMWVTLQLAGVTNLAVLALGVLATWSHHALAYAWEALSVPRPRWGPAVPCALIWAGKWVIAFVYLGFLTQSAAPPGAGGAAWFAYTGPVGLAVLSLPVGLVLVLRCGRGWSGLATEIMLVVATSAARLFFCWNLFVGVAASPY